MTLIVSVISTDGIVIAGDSLSSLNGQINVQQSGQVLCPHCKEECTVNTNLQGNLRQATYSYTEKVFPFLENYGIGVFGSGLIGSRSVNFLIRAIEHELKEKNKVVGYIADLAEEIAINLHNSVRKQLEAEEKSLNDFGEEQTLLGFQIVGYDKLEPQIIEVLLGRGIRYNEFSGVGCYASGNMNVVRAIWELYRADPGIHPIYEVFSLQEAIDYAEFLISSTISFQRFSPKVPDVGGEIDIALVRPFGSKLQWIRQKQLGKLL